MGVHVRRYDDEQQRRVGTGSVLVVGNLMRTYPLYPESADLMLIKPAAGQLNHLGLGLSS